MCVCLLVGDKVKRAGGLLVFLKLFVNVKDGVAAVREMTVVMEEKGCKWELFNILIHFVQNGSSVCVCVCIYICRNGESQIAIWWWDGREIQSVLVVKNSATFTCYFYDFIPSISLTYNCDFQTWDLGAHTRKCPFYQISSFFCWIDFGGAQ